MLAAFPSKMASWTLACVSAFRGSVEAILFPVLPLGAKRT